MKRLIAFLALVPCVALAQWSNDGASLNACVKTSSDFVTVGLGADVSFQTVFVAGTSTSADAITIHNGRLRLAPTTQNSGAVIYWGTDGIYLDSNTKIAAGGSIFADNVEPRQSTLPVVVKGTHGLRFDAQSSVDACVSGLKGQFTTKSSDGRSYYCDGTTSQLVGFVLSNSAALDFPNLTSHTSSTLTMAVTGAASGDFVSCSASAAVEDDLHIQTWVSAADTVSVRAHNDSGGDVDPASATYKCVIVR